LVVLDVDEDEALLDDVDASARTAVPPLSREHAATPGTASITTAVAAHTSRVTPPV